MKIHTKLYMCVFMYFYVYVYVYTLIFLKLKQCIRSLTQVQPTVILNALLDGMCPSALVPTSWALGFHLSVAVLF